MPIGVDPDIATHALVVLGTGDVALAPATAADDPHGPNRWLLNPGGIGRADAVGREEELARVLGAVGDRAVLPAGVALYFGNATAVDQVLAALTKIRNDLATAEATDGTTERV